MSYKLELLSPAGNAETGIAAINAGADAVYIGAPRFGARAAAGASLKEIETLIRHAHFFRARVYLAINTLLTDEELPEALAIIRQAADAGIDALIIQDFGLLQAGLPPVPIIASTQMDNRSPEKVRFLESIGIRRAILARELSLEEIRNIRSLTENIELEFFVHGALCMGYSGRCYLSEEVAGRSGNRGVCAQPCRSDYHLKDSQGRIIDRDAHLLSLKDLNLSACLEDLIDAGITSFKIEGRLKDAAYVTNITAWYRRHLDHILEKHPDLTRSSSGKSEYAFSPDPDRTFNRGYTSHFTGGRQAGLTSPRSPKALGQLLGPAGGRQGGGLRINTPEAIHNNDGLCFFDGQGRLAGFKVNRSEGSVVFASALPDIPPGTPVYRNHDHAFHQLLARKDAAIRKIGVRFLLKESAEGACLEASDEDGNCSCCESGALFTAANNPEKAREAIQRQLARTGATPFFCTEIQIEMKDPPFIQASELNRMRREVLEKLENTRKSHQVSPPVSALSESALPYPGLWDEEKRNVLNQKAAEFLWIHGLKEAAPVATGNIPLPISGVSGDDGPLMTAKFCLLHEKGMCLLSQPDALKNAKISLPLFLENNRRVLRLAFDCKKCEMRLFRV